jgi:hypothetical protein
MMKETVVSKPRKVVTELVKKRLIQESRGRCPFCDETDAATFQYHHIDGDPLNSGFTNLMLVCSSCHSRIEHGLIATGEVVAKKNGLKGFLKEDQVTSGRESGVHVNVRDSIFRGVIAQNVYKLSRATKPPAPPIIGSVRANIAMKGYLDYLISRYHELRKADALYGRNVKYNYAVLHVGIQRLFGARTFDLPESAFSSLVQHLKDKIDETIQGRVNRKSGKASYHSFEEHCSMHGLS